MPELRAMFYAFILWADGVIYHAAHQHQYELETLFHLVASIQRIVWPLLIRIFTYSFLFFLSKILYFLYDNTTFSSSSMFMFILWLSHFDVIYASSFPVYHRHCKMDFTSMQVAKLRRLLQEMCISCFFFIGNII